MSNVLLITVNQNEYSLLISHYRDILSKLNRFSFTKKGYYLDAGYLIVDHDRSTIVSCQSAFSAAHVRNLRMRRYSWVVL